MRGVGGADMAAISSEFTLPSREGSAETRGISCACRSSINDIIAGDIAIAEGGVGGIGDVNFFASMGLASSGITNGASERRESPDPLESLRRLLLLFELRCRLIPLE